MKINTIFLRFYKLSRFQNSRLSFNSREIVPNFYTAPKMMMENGEVYFVDIILNILKKKLNQVLKNIIYFFKDILNICYLFYLTLKRSTNFGGYLEIKHYLLNH